MFKDRFKELRTAYKYTQNEIADFFNVAVNTVYSWENGMFIPEKTKLVKMADFFNVSVDYLLGMDNKRYIEVSDLTPEQVAHIQQIINDLREAGK